MRKVNIHIVFRNISIIRVIIFLAQKLFMIIQQLKKFSHTTLAVIILINLIIGTPFFSSWADEDIVSEVIQQPFGEESSAQYITLPLDNYTDQQDES